MKISFFSFISVFTPIVVLVQYRCVGALQTDQNVQHIIGINKCCENGYRLFNGHCRSYPDKSGDLNTNFTSELGMLSKTVFSSLFPHREDSFSTRLQQNIPVCTRGSIDLKISVSTTESERNGTTGANASFAINGYVKYNMEYFSPDEYCIQSFTEDEISLSVCKAQCDSQRPCIRKCCEIDEVWDLSNYETHEQITCKSSGSKFWSPTFYSDRYTKLSTENSSIPVHYKVDHPKNWCNGSFIILTLKDFSEQKRSPFRILRDGSIVHKVRRRSWNFIPYDEICLDGIQNYPGEKQALYNGDETDTIIIDCRQNYYNEEPMEMSSSTSTLYPCVMIVALIFLFLTATVFIVLWKHQNIHGWTILGHVVSLFFQYVFLISANLLNEEGTLCDITAIGGHFFFLSTFTWLTAINFDIFWTFWKLAPSSGRKSEIKRFCYYAIFAVGVPVTIVVIGLVLDYSYGNDPDSEIITPDYGKSRCFLNPEYAQLPYLYGPIGFLLTANVIFFSATLFCIHKKLKLVNTTKFKTEKLKQKLRFFAKLFVVVGITWIFEIVSWASSKENEPIQWYWIMFDLINMLQAVAIFIIFVCNAETVYNLEQKFPCFKKIRNLMSKKEDANTFQGRRTSLHTQASVVENNGFENVELK